ncbi:MAG: O-antigen ligase family protein [Candidatus Schekmanbacteria bacterium]|nr:O-antigen ligase family protein [Candidatus Schekmanbacteria bacterium]
MKTWESSKNKPDKSEIPPYKFKSGLPRQTNHISANKSGFIKSTLSSCIGVFTDIVEPFYWQIANKLKLTENSRFLNILSLLKRHYILVVTVLMGYFLAKGIFIYPARYIVIFSFAPVFGILAFTKPIVGLILYMVAVLGQIQDAVWNFPKFYMGNPLLIIVYGGMILNAILLKETKLEYVHDSLNFPAVGLWLMSFLHVTFELSQAYQTAVQESCMLAYFICLHVICSKKQNFRYVLFTLAGIFIFYAYQTMRKAAYYGLGTDYTVTSEIAGRMEDNNELAACLNMALPLIYVASVIIPPKNKKNLILKFGFLAAFIFTMVAVIYTRSRGGYLTLGAVFTILSYKFFLKTSKNRITSILLLCFILTGTYVFYFEKINARIQETVNWETDSSAHNRILSLATGIEMMKAHPLTGVGLGKAMPNFVAYCPQILEMPTSLFGDEKIRIHHPKHALVIHNAYAQVLGETGLPGIILYLSLVAGAVYKMRRLRKVLPKTEDNEWVIPVTHALECSFIAFMISSFFLSNAQLEFMYVLAACCASLYYLQIGKDRIQNNKLNLIMIALVVTFTIHWVYLTVGLRVGIIKM